MALVPIINQIREKSYYTNEKIIEEKSEVLGEINDENLNNNKTTIFESKLFSGKYYKVLQLVYIRFVGIESLMAVSSYPDKSFDNFKEAFDERINYSNYNYYYVKYVLIDQKEINEKFLLDKKILQEINIQFMFLVLFLSFIIQDQKSS